MAATPYTDEEILRIRTELERQLGPEYISTRPAGGGRVSYLEGSKALNLANRIFGFNGWSSEIKNTQVDYVDDHNGSGRVNLGLSITVRITLKDGTYHEDIGYGHIENAKSRAMAFEKCKKEAMTDGLKRAMRCFGNALGNCLYDKAYLTLVAKMKVPAVVMDEERLLRHHAFEPIPPAQPAMARSIAPVPSTPMAPKAPPTRPPVPAKSSPHPTHPVAARAPIAPSTLPLVKAVPPARLPVALVPPPSPQSTPNTEGPILPTPLFEDDFDDSFCFSDDLHPEDFDNLEETLLREAATVGVSTDTTVPPTRVLHSPSRKRAHIETVTPLADRVGVSPGEQGAPAPAPALIPETVTFFSAKAAPLVQSNAPVDAAASFDPHYQSPSLRKVYTLDPTKSLPVKRANLAPKAPTIVPSRGLAPIGRAPALAPKRVGAPPSAPRRAAPKHSSNVPGSPASQREQVPS